MTVSPSWCNGIVSVSADSDPVQRSKRQLHRSLGPIPSPEPTTPSVVATFATKPSILNGDISGVYDGVHCAASSAIAIFASPQRGHLRCV